nr:MAG TPA: hypothetical protein [Caudoviricetes sp.]
MTDEKWAGIIKNLAEELNLKCLSLTLAYEENERLKKELERYTRFEEVAKK